jgi:glycosyltransferase involved in cell wall biosynthesis
LYIALGYANDEDYIEKIIQYEEKLSLLKKNNVFLVIRSKCKTLDSDSIKIIKGFLTKEEYNSYYYNCRGLLLLYPNTYKYRFSGAVLDALSYGKKIIGTDIPIFDYFSKSFPESCCVFKDIEDLFSQILALDTLRNNKYLEEFQLEYSDENIKKKLKNILDI